MIKLHHIFRLVFGFAMVEFCRFFYYYQYNTGPSYEKFTPSAPSISAEQQQLLNVSPSSKYQGLSQVGNQNIYLSGNKAYQQDQSGLLYLQPLGTNTRFKEYTGDITGFNYDKDAGTYSPSMAYISALQRAQTPYVPHSAQQAPISILGYNPSVMSNVYTPASPNVQLNMPTGEMHGAGRFLGGTDGLLGSMPLNFGLPSGESNNG